MHDGILAGPSAFGEVAQRTAESLPQLGWKLQEASELMVVGAGSSLYAAQFAQYLSWEVLKTKQLRAISSSDFVEFCPAPSPSTVGICVSHRGTEKYTSQSVERFVRLGQRCLYVVGQKAKLSHLAEGGFEVLETTPQDQSPAHTWSYVGSMAVLCALLQELNPRHPLLLPSVLNADVPDALEGMLVSEEIMKQLAEECTGARKIWIVGAGSDAVIAREIALKIVETSYIVAQGYELEEVIQGPLQGADRTDVFILLNLIGRLGDRMNSLREALGILTIRSIVFSSTLGELKTQSVEAISNKMSTWVSIPRRLPYPYVSLQALIPLQFFAYYLAIACGRHPDSFRLDEEPFRLGREKLPG
jgi:glucosamine--fructose-6-phosphate aminotransferase (isomerizing)